MTIDRLESGAMKGMHGNYIGGAWVTPSQGKALQSIDPSTPGTIVAQALGDPDASREAALAAERAQPAWFAKSLDERFEALTHFADALEAHAAPMAEAMSSEMGKLLSEAHIEVKSLWTRIRGAEHGLLETLRPSPVEGAPAELRHHPLGVIAILGPFNFPLHLMHAHVVPALLAGNAVVLKPSERTLLTAQRYVEAWHSAGLPPVLNGSRRWRCRRRPRRRRAYPWRHLHRLMEGGPRH